MNRILIALLTCVAGVAAQSSGGLSVEGPAGWRRNANPQTGVVSFIPPNLPPGRDAVVLVFPAQDATGPAQAVLDQLVRNATAGHQPIVAPTYLDIGPFRVAVFSQQTRVGQQHMAIHVARWGSRAQAIAFVTSDGDTLQAYGSAVQAMLGAIVVPADAPAAAAPPRAVGPAAPASRPQVVEAYRRPARRTYMNIDGSTFGGRVQFERIVLLSNGVADFSLYHATGLGADRDLLAATTTTLNGFYGTWRAEGNTIRLRRQAGLAEEVMTRENGNLRFGDQLWTPTPRVDGWRLTGRYQHRSEPNGPLQYNYWVEFTADGRFQTGGLLSWLAVSDLTGRPKPPEQAAGTYEIRDWTIWFIVNGVAVWSTEIMPLQDDVRNPATILIDTYGFRRQ